MAKIFSDQDTWHVLAEVCGKCYDEAIDSGMSEAEIAATMDGNGEDCYSFGVYAGHYCSRHWRTSGYKGSTEDTADEQFDPDFAGESMDEEE